MIDRWWKAFLAAAMTAGVCSSAWAQARGGLEGSYWSIVEVYGEPLPQDETPSIAFEERGTLSGRTACNWFHGTYSAERNKIVILTRLTTLRGCEVDGRRRRDPTLEAFDSTHTFVGAGGVLITLLDADGEPVVRMVRRRDDRE